jgi:hypothetical protein
MNGIAIRPIARGLPPADRGSRSVRVDSEATLAPAQDVEANLDAAAREADTQYARDLEDYLMDSAGREFMFQLIELSAEEFDHEEELAALKMRAYDHPAGEHLGDEGKTVERIV